MGRTFLRQDAQIRNSVTYDDTKAAGSTMESSPVDIEADLNCVRSQIKRLFLADASGDWFQDVDAIGGVKRGVKALATDLYDLESKKLLFRAQVLTDITVTAAQNWEVLSVAGSEAPSEVAAVGAGTANGAVVAVLAGDVGAHALTEVAGQNALNPKNLVIVRDATTGDPILSGGKTVYGLIQAETGTLDGETFNDTTKQVQISFVRENATADDLEACPVADIATKSVNYAYVRRINLDGVPEQAFLGGMFVDQSAGVDVTLDNAIDNQSGPATQTQSIEWRISDTYSLKWQTSDGLLDLLAIIPNVAGDEIEINIDTLDVNNALDADFLNGATFDSGGTGVRVGVTQGYIDTASADLGIRAGAELYLDDANQTGSTWAQTTGIKLSDTTAEWDAFEVAYGEVSLLNAIVAAKNSGRSKTSATVTSAIPANTDAGGTGGGSNLDAQLGDYNTKTFVTDVDVFLNGKLLRNGADAAANNDVYPGTSKSLGQLKFEFALHASPGNPDQITMLIY